MNNRIKELRKQLGLTQQEFADRLKLKRNTIATYEMGKATPSNRTISDICEAYNVNREWLETGKGDMFQKLDKKSELSAFFKKALSGELLASVAETLVSQKEKDLSKIPTNPEDLEKLYPPIERETKDVG